MTTKISALVDKFTLAVLNSKLWDFIGETPTVVGGRLRLTQGEGIVSKDYYDLTGSQAVFRVDQDGTADFNATFSTAVGDLVSAESKNDRLIFSLREGPFNTTLDGPYDPTTMKVWRVREKGGVLFLDTSIDSANWTVQFQLPYGLADFTAVKAQFMNAAGTGFGFGPVGLGFGFGPFGGIGTASPLPAKVVGGYFAKYKSKDDAGLVRDMEFQDINSHYDLVYLFQAGPIEADHATYPKGSGKVDLIHEGGGAFFSQAEWRAGVQFLRKRGTTVLLTVGGGGAYIDLSSRANTLNLIQSVRDIYNQVGGIDGVDFNLETSYAYIAGGRYINADPTVVPAIEVLDDGYTIHDPNLLNRLNPNTGEPNLLLNDELLRMPLVIKIQSGAGVGQIRNVVGNTVDTIKIDVPYDPPIDGTSYYAIGIPMFADEVVFAAQEFRRIFGKSFAITVPAAAGFFGPFVQHDFDLVDKLYRNHDANGKILLDFLAPQFYDMWYDAPNTTQSARASFVIAQIAAWAARVDNDWQRVGIGNLTTAATAQGFANSAMTPDACALAYLLTQVEHPTIRGAFHFDIQDDARTNSGAAPRDAWAWINDLYPIINATTVGGNPIASPTGLATDWAASTGWTLSGGASVSGGNLLLPSTDYGVIPEARFNSTISLNLGPSTDGYFQIEMTGMPTSPEEAWFDVGFYGATDNDYMFFRIYQATGHYDQGYEFHFNRATDPTPRATYYPVPVSLSAARFIRMRKLLSYIFIQYSAGSGDKMHNLAFESQDELIPFTGPLTPFIRANGHSSAGGNWTIASVNTGP